MMAYMMMTLGMTLAEAWQLCVSQRRCVSPNQGFSEQLIDLEERIHGRNSVTFDQLLERGWIQRNRAVCLSKS